MTFSSGAAPTGAARRGVRPAVESLRATAGRFFAPRFCLYRTLPSCRLRTAAGGLFSWPGFLLPGRPTGRTHLGGKLS